MKKQSSYIFRCILSKYSSKRFLLSKPGSQPTRTALIKYQTAAKKSVVWYSTTLHLISERTDRNPQIPMYVLLFGCLKHDYIGRSR